MVLAYPDDRLRAEDGRQDHARERNIPSRSFAGPGRQGINPRIVFFAALFSPRSVGWQTPSRISDSISGLRVTHTPLRLQYIAETTQRMGAG